MCIRDSYDLEDDIGEKKNLAAKLPETASDLLSKLRAWRKSSDAWMPRPRKS